MLAASSRCRSQWLVALLATACGVAFAPPGPASAADVIKANNTTALNLAGSWVSGGPPGTADVGVWDSTVTGANSSALGGSLSVLGLRVTNPSGAITIGATTSATLTLGSSGIDMSTATQNLTVSPSIVIGANQTWTVAGGRTLSGIAGAGTSSGSGTGNITMSQAGSGLATIVFNQNGNTGSGQTGWSNYSGTITVNPNVKVQSQGNAAAAFGSGTMTLAGGQVAQRDGNWTWGNNIDVTADSVIGTDSSSGLGRTLKLLGDLGSSNGSGLTFTNNVTGGTRTDDFGFLLAGANASTYGTTTISSNSRVRVGGNATASLAAPGFDAGTRGSLGTGDVNLAATSAELAFTRTDAHTVANNISGSGTVVIGGNTAALAGTSTQVVTLSGTNTYTGSTRVSRSRLNLTGTMTSAITVDTSGSISGTGSTTGLLTLSSGSVLALAGGATTTSLTVNGATFSGSNLVTFLTAATPNTAYDVFTYGSGTVTNPGNLTVAWRGTLSDDAVNQKYVFTAGDVGTRTWTQASGTWQVGSTGSWSGGDDIYYNGDTAIFNEPSAASTVTLSGALAPGGVQVNNTANAYTFTGTSIAGTGSLTKSGAGILTLATANDYSGGTTLSAGRIRVGVNTALGSGTLALNGGAISSDSGTTRTLANALSIGGNVVLGDATDNGLLVFSGVVNLQGATRTLDSRLTSNLGASLSGMISNGGIELNGGSTAILTLSNNANSFTGPTTVTSGYLAITTGAIAGSSSVSLAANTRLFVGETGTTSINNLSGASTSAVRTDFTITGGNGDRVIVVNQTADGSFDGSFVQGSSRPISLTKSGAATLTLTGTGTYTGATTVSAGTLAIGGAGVLGGGSYAGSISNAATLHFDSSATQTLSGTLTGSGAILKSNTGTLIVTSNNTYTGTLTIDAGTFQIGNGGTSGFLGNFSAITNNASLVFNRSNDTNVGNAISGTGSLTKEGAGITSLNGANTYSGTTSIAAGTLRVGNGGTTGTLGTGNVVNNASLLFSRSDDITVANVISGTGTLTKAAVGTVSLTGASTYTGGTTVGGGTLLVNGSLANTSGVSVASAATLGGSGSIGGPTSILAGGILSPGTSPGTLTITNTLSLADTSILDFEIDAADPSSSVFNDLITGVTDLTLGGTLNLTGSGDFSTVSGGTLWRLINYTGTLTDNTLAIGTAPTLAAGLSFSVDTATDGQVNLVVVPEPGALALAALGLVAGLGWLGRRRA